MNATTRKNLGICFHIITRNFSVKTRLKDLLINMPKEAVHVPALKAGRKAKKETFSKYPAGIINLQVLGSGAKGAPRSLYVFTDQTRYLFNCGEGTQRLAHEHKMKLAKLEHIFLTSNSWENTGGLPGVALTIQDIGVPEITLHGAPRIEKLFQGTRRFVILKDLRIKIADMTSDKFSDHVLQVDYVKLLPASDETVDKSSSSEESVVEEDDIDYYAPIKGCKRNLDITQEGGDQSKRVKVDSPESVTFASENPDTVLCYVCRPREKEGMLLIDKCLEHGVPPGPLLGKLKAGEDVTLPNGTVVKSNDVRTPHCPGPVFIVVDCPDDRYIDALVNNPILNQFHTPTKPQDLPYVVVHFTPSDVVRNPLYKNWMEKFRCTTKHMMINDACMGLGSESVHRIQHKLNMLDTEIFPMLNEEGIEHFYPSTEEGKSNQLDVLKPPEKLADIQAPLIMGSTLLKFALRPSPGLDSYSSLVVNPENDTKSVLVNEEFPPLLESLTSKLVALPERDSAYPEFVFFGTGSSIPNKTRNTSAILVHIDSDCCMLMDCGEGTYGQLVRFYGSVGVDEVLLKLKIIYISHLHADHHMGLVHVIRKRQEVFKQKSLPPTPVYLLAPHQIQTWLQLYSKSFENIKNAYILLPNVELRYNNKPPQESIVLSEVKHTAGFGDIQTTYVRHCPNAFGVAFTHLSGWKITYSGDTMPCNSLVDIGQDSDVLIHEATMEDDLKQEAVLKMHSTTSEAIEIGNKMNAKFILLTHFSQRYAKVPVINEKFGSNVGIAFDNMKLRKCDLPRIPLMYDAMKVMFTDDVEEMEQKYKRRVKRRELGGMLAAQLSEVAS